MPAFDAHRQPAEPQRHILAAGQQLSLRVPPGAALQLRRGQAVVHEPPRWVGETVLRLAARLAEGQVHVCAEGGWVSVQAGAERCELWCHAPMKTATRGWPLKRLWLTAVAAVRGSGLRSAGGC